MTALKIDGVGPGGRRRPLLVADDADVREVSVLAGIIQPVSNDELVFDAEPDVLDPDVDLAPRRFAEEARRTHVAWRAGFQNVLQIRERQTGVDDVFHDQDVAAFDRTVKILDQLYLPGRLRARPVAR